MATSGTNNTVSWTYADGTLTIKPKSGTSGIATRTGEWLYNTYNLMTYIPLDESAQPSVTKIVISGSVRFKESHKDPISGNTVTNWESPKLNSSDNKLTNVTTVDFSGWDATGCTSLNYLLCDSVESANLSIKNLADDISVYSLAGKSLKRFDNAEYGWTAKLGSVQGMLSNSSKLEYVCMSGIDLSGLSNGEYFIGANSTLCTLDLTSTGLNAATASLGLSFLDAAFSKTAMFDESGSIVDSQEAFDQRRADGDVEHVWTIMQGDTVLKVEGLSVSRNEYDLVVNASVANSDAATVKCYIKDISETDYPTDASLTVELTSGKTALNQTIRLTDDAAKDLKMVVTMGELNLVKFADVDSNTLAFEVDGDGVVTFHQGIVASRLTATGDTTVTNGDECAKVVADTGAAPSGASYTSGTYVQSNDFCVQVHESDGTVSEGIRLYQNSSGGSTASFGYGVDNVVYYKLANSFAITTVTLFSSKSFTSKAYADGSVTLAKADWYPLGIIGEIVNTRYVTINRKYLESRKVGGATLRWMAENWDTSTHSATANVNVLWARG